MTNSSWSPSSGHWATTRPTASRGHHEVTTELSGQCPQRVGVRAVGGRPAKDSGQRWWARMPAVQHRRLARQVVRSTASPLDSE
ncbi:hypothetical protein ACFOWZ_07845 [Lentzea rhizosphaerae]|uniref:Uncharacterized protein n=1 Tax=Lentzea rhizosphaerae TaxID=2041025 RepID=A0ABV8BN71_9PSEU